jgi:hypothetical protein
MKQRHAIDCNRFLSHFVHFIFHNHPLIPLDASSSEDSEPKRVVSHERAVCSGLRTAAGVQTGPHGQRVLQLFLGRRGATVETVGDSVTQTL